MRDPGDVTPSFLTRAMSWAQGGTPRVAPASRAGAAAPGAVTVDVGLATTKRGGAVSFDDKPPPPSPSLAGGDAGDIEGLDIAFDRLSFTVPGRRGGGGIQILREACGYAAAGRLTAMQGPSGAGKVREREGGGRDLGAARGTMGQFGVGAPPAPAPAAWARAACAQLVATQCAVLCGREGGGGKREGTRGRRPPLHRFY
jgi:hypothetical protein